MNRLDRAGWRGRAWSGVRVSVDNRVWNRVSVSVYGRVWSRVWSRVGDRVRNVEVA